MVLKVKKSYLMQAVKRALRQDAYVVDGLKRGKLDKQPTVPQISTGMDKQGSGDVTLTKQTLQRIISTMYGAGWTVEQIAQAVKMPVQWVQKAAQTEYWNKMAKQVHFMPKHQIEKQRQKQTGMKDYQGEMKQQSKQPLKQKTPKGYEKIVRGLKRNPGVDNPWRVRNRMKNKGIKPKK